MSTSRPNVEALEQDLAETVVPGRQGGGEATVTHIDTGNRATTTPPTEERAKPQVRQGEAKKVVRLGDFEIRKQLGQGGMGKVYLAHQISLDRDCALKVMSSELAQKPGFVDRFIREARAMAKIDHPHVVKCYAVDQQEGKHFVAMELIDGKSMQDWLDELGTLSVEDAVHVILICAEALEHAHGLNMIHRDIKPDNILVTRHGVVKVADLGLAKAIDDDMSMTQSGTGLGTPHYMPPEQARDAKHVDARCDIYALGCTLYHFVTGELPFSGDSVLELIKAKELGKFTPARRLNSKVPERLDLMIDKMMAKDARHRYASCAEVISDLESLNLAGESLSFIDSDQKAVLRRRGVASTPRIVPTDPAPSGRTSQRRASIGKPSSPSSRKEASRKGATDSPRPRNSDAAEDVWYVQYADQTGKVRISKMTRAQILQGLKSDLLDLKTRVSRTGKSDFRRVAQVPVFEGEAKRAATRAQANRRQTNLANAYAKIERQYNRQKWWRLLARFRDGTLGLVGLIVWLAIVLIAIVALGLGVMYGYQYLGNLFGL